MACIWWKAIWDAGKLTGIESVVYLCHGGVGNTLLASLLSVVLTVTQCTVSNSLAFSGNSFLVLFSFSFPILCSHCACALQLIVLCEGSKCGVSTFP